MQLDKLLVRHYTKSLENSNNTVYDLFKWKKVNVKLTNYSTGEIITNMTDLEFPEDYSQSACDIIASKYFRRKGIPNERDSEYSMKQLVHRMVNFWVESLHDAKLINEKQKEIIYDELSFMLLSQIWAPNSPQWFNTGLKLSYNINSPSQGHFYFDEKQNKVVQSKDAYTKTQGSACFIISIEDKLVGDKSLTDQLTTETLLFKYGSGVGTNWSPIRGKNEFLSGGGKSSGLLSFLKVSDKNAGAIKSGGATRRAAKMNILDLDHPEILEYINWKSKEEDKVVALGKMGYSLDMDGEAYETVSGQNANNSVRVSNDFMEKIKLENSVQKLIGRVDSSLDSEIFVEKIWDDLAYATWRCGDPGIQFDNTINDWHTCPYGEDGDYNKKYNRINASNPCSEYMFLDDTACNLASINVTKFYDAKNNNFDIESYLHCIKLIQLVLESTIHWGHFPTKDIARKSYLFRTTGLGLTNLGMLFLQLAIPYDSLEARTLASSLCSLMTGYSYLTSSLMAEKIGAFKKYDLNKNSMLKIIRNHSLVANFNEENYFEDLNYSPEIINHEILNKMSFKNISKSLKEVWNDTIESGNKNGFRNAQVTVLAPTGTISFAMDSASTSSEPFFSHVTYKKLVGGGFMEIVNPGIEDGLKKLKYSNEEIKSILEFVLRKDENGNILDGKIEDAPFLKEEHYSIFDTANKCGSGERFISPMGHVKMMAALTPNITGAISKTVNLPNHATKEDVKEIYFTSWKSGIKSIALYRDGCKATQPLNTALKNIETNSLDDYSYKALQETIKNNLSKQKVVRHKPKGIRKAKVHEASINGLKLYITTSFYEDGKLGEIYVSSGRQGSLTKGLLDSISTTISKMLQYGVPATDISRMYRGQKFEPSGFVKGHPFIKNVDSISDLISKIIDIELGDYTYCQIKPDIFTKEIISTENSPPALSSLENKTYDAGSYIYGDICPTCGSSKMVKNGSCKVCTECGSTTGCS